MINFRYISNITGKLILIEAVMICLCAFIALFYGEKDLFGFIASSVIAAIIGIILMRIKADNLELAKRDAYLIVSVVWLAFSLIGCLPYIINGSIPNFADAFFETMSGFSTTGASAVTDIDSLPHATLFWRSLTQWLGGLGIIMLFIALLPSLGIEGADLYVAEVPGITHQKTSSTFSNMARDLWKLYIAFTFMDALLLSLGGMSVFDSVCHALTTMSSGGFSTKQDSIAHWHSGYIEYVTIAFMFIAGTNFSIIYLALKGKLKKLFQNTEFQLYASIIILCTGFVAIGLYSKQWIPLERSIREALFQVVSIITTTGFATSDYVLWPPIYKSIIFMLFFIGGCAGSTAGGIKVVRIMLLFKNSLSELHRIIHPKAVINVKLNKKGVPAQTMESIMAFFIMYILIFGFGSFIISLSTKDFSTACSAVASCMGNIGPGFGAVGPSTTYAGLNNFCKILLSILMMVGRLEIFTVMIVFTKDFWKS